MTQVQTSIDIARPPQEVFAFIGDAANAPKWMGMCHSLELAAPLHDGAAARYAYKEGGHTRSMEGKVSAYDPPRLLELTLADKQFQIVVSMHVEPVSDGSLFEYDLEITPKGLVAKLMGPLVRSATQKQIEKDVAQLKQLLEARR